MDLDLYQYVIIIVGSFIAGVVNTLAGNGSAITLSILTEVIGLPGNIANGSNRVGVTSQGLVSSYAFHKNGKLNIVANKQLIIFITLGALIGVYVATIISNEAFKEVFKYLLVLMLFVVLVNPKRWLIETQINHQVPSWLGIPLYLAIGFYGGFIQMGMGILFLALLVLVAKQNIIDANAIKAFTVFFYTIFVLGYFHYKGLVDWKAGALLAVGQTLGGYLTAEYASRYKGAEIWAYRLLVIIIILVILKMFGIINI